MKTKIFILGFLFMTTLSSCGQENNPEFNKPIKLLIFSKTNGFRHTDEAFRDNIIIEHITNAINWAAGRIN